MKSLMWAGSAYPESMFLGAAICWVLNGFSGPNFIKNVKTRCSRISNLLFLCIYFFRKKTPQKKETCLSKMVMQNHFNFKFLCDYWISFLIYYFTQQSHSCSEQLISGLNFLAFITGTELRLISTTWLVDTWQNQHIVIQYVTSIRIQKTKPKAVPH